MKKCEFCGRLTPRTQVTVIGGRAFPETPVCATCAKCPDCGVIVEARLVEGRHGCYVVEMCECADGHLTKV